MSRSRTEKNRVGDTCFMAVLLTYICLATLHSVASNYQNRALCWVNYTVYFSVEFSDRFGPESCAHVSIFISHLIFISSLSSSSFIKFAG